MKTDQAGTAKVAGRRGGCTHLDTIPLQIVQLLAKLFRREIDLSENFTHQRAGHHFLHTLAINDGQSAHPATSICCKPTNRGSSSPLTRYSSRHNSRTSFRFFWSSSSVLPCVCAPEIPGTKPTYSSVSGSHSRYAANVLIDNTSTVKQCQAGQTATITESRAFVEIHKATNMESRARELRMVGEAAVPKSAE